MLDLYLSELRRFRNSAAIYGIASLLILTLLSQLGDLTAQVDVHFFMLAAYMVSGLGLAVYQFGTYRQPSRWIWLQHRPLHRARILAAIAGASITLIALVAALPLFITLFTLDHFTTRVIDQRHYAGVAFLALSTLSAWLAGAYIVLHRSRWAFVILVLPLLLTMHLASFGTVLALSLGCNVLLLFLVYTVFRPSRYTESDPVATIATAIPLQASLYLALLWAGSTLFQGGQMLAGVHPLSSDHPRRGGYYEAMRFDPRETMLAGLASATDARAPAWRTALTQSNTVFAGPSVRQYAVRDVMTNKRSVQFVDSEQNAWTFSHDHMLYSGRNKRTHADVGWYGTGGRGDTHPFDGHPVPMRDNAGHGYLATGLDIYQSLGAGSQLRHWWHVDGTERISGIAELGGQTTLLTNQRMIILQRGAAQAHVAAAVPLPRPFGDLARADVAQVPDGLLVSFVYGLRRLDGVMEAPQLTYLVAPAGQVREVARRELAHDFPVLFEHKDWWLSPALDALVSLPSILIDNGTLPDAGVSRFEPLTRSRPAAAWAAAILAALASMAGAAWWTRRSRMPARERAIWCCACLVLGPPALLSLMVLRRREQAAPAQAKKTAPLAPA